MTDDLEDISEIRADHVGSLIRPQMLLEARMGYDDPDAARASDQPKSASLLETEDRCIRAAVAMQARVGLRLATDGEFRRLSYFMDFIKALGGLSAVMDTQGFTFVDGSPTSTIEVRDKIVWPDGGITVADYSFLNSLTSVAGMTAKVSLPSPVHAQFFDDTHRIATDAYGGVAEFWDDLVEVYQKELAALAAAGCRYVQFDETTFVKLCDEKFVARMREMGGDPERALGDWIDVINRVAVAKPAGMTLAVHFCRGNGPGGAWISEGGYDPVAERVFGELAADRLLLEYDSDRAGGFEPLRFVPKDRTVVLGLVTTKSPDLETADALKRRIDAAGKFVSVDQLALSPQCGFASGKAAAQMTIAQEEDKLRRVVEVADAVWG